MVNGAFGHSKFVGVKDMGGFKNEDFWVSDRDH